MPWIGTKKYRPRERNWNFRAKQTKVYRRVRKVTTRIRINKRTRGAAKSNLEPHNKRKRVINSGLKKPAEYQYVAVIRAGTVRSKARLNRGKIVEIYSNWAGTKRGERKFKI